MKVRMQREQIVVLERIVYSDNLANITFSRYGKCSDWITERRIAEEMEAYVGDPIKLTIDCWFDFTWMPLEEG